MASPTRAQVRGFRVRAQQLDRESGELAQTPVLDLGVQDTGFDGGLWALAVRGIDVSHLSDRELVGVWTIRGAPHLYRREDLPFIPAAVEPFSDADAGKRIYDAAKPLKAAGIASLAALDAVAAAMASVVTAPTVKGEVSGQLAELLPAPYLRFCRPCQATHVHEMPFRLAALRAGLELVPGTSPPVLRPIPGFAPATAPSDRFDVIRGYLALMGPATPKHVADYLDAPLKDVRARWPSDAVEVSVEGETRWVLGADEGDIATAPPALVRLLGPFDPFLQAKDRSTLVEDPARAKALWPVLGRPGAVLLDGDIVGTWRPRTSGGRLTVRVELWNGVPARVHQAIADQAERLAAYRRVQLAGVELAA